MYVSIQVQSGASTPKSSLNLVSMGDAQHDWLKLAILTKLSCAKLLAWG